MIRIRLYPTPEQDTVLKQWFGTARWTYNRCLDEGKRRGIKRQLTQQRSALRAACLNRDAFEGKEDLKWVLDTPYDVRDEAMNDLLKAYQTNFAKLGKNPEHTFEVRFRSKKRSTQEAIVIHSKHYNRKRGIYADLFRSMRSHEPLPNEIQYDARLTRTNKLGHYYLCLPQPLEVRPESQGPQFSEEARHAYGAGVVALDPGVRTFQTCYDPSGRIVEWGAKDIGRIYRLCHAHDKLQSKWSQQKSVRHASRYRMRKAAARIRLKIRNLVDELHKRLAKWLCENYEVVLLPAVETSQMLRRGQRRIRSKTARAMATWSHYRFKQRLLNKAREYPWCEVVIVDEAYTSKTCGSCGCLNERLGGSKHFHCPHCHFHIDRDANGARNIVIRFRTLLNSRKKSTGVIGPRCVEA